MLEKDRIILSCMRVIQK